MTKFVREQLNGKKVPKEQAENLRTRRTTNLTENACGDIIIWIYVICYNEIILAPFMIDYWKTYAKKVIIYDNGSNDGCLELFAKYDWIEVRHFETGGLNDFKHIEIKNNCWKECRDRGVDYVQVSDFDEIPYCDNMLEELKKHKERGDYIFDMDILSVTCENMPEYDSGKLLHMNEDFRFYKINSPTIDFEKAILFDPNKIKEINYSVGCHQASPISDEEYIIKTKTNIRQFHFDKLSIDFTLKKNIARRARNSENIKHGYGIQYYYSTERVINEHNEFYKKSLKYNELPLYDADYTFYFSKRKFLAKNNVTTLTVNREKRTDNPLRHKPTITRAKARQKNIMKSRRGR